MPRASTQEPQPTTHQADDAGQGHDHQHQPVGRQRQRQRIAQHQHRRRRRWSALGSGFTSASDVPPMPSMRLRRGLSFLAVARSMKPLSARGRRPWPSWPPAAARRGAAPRRSAEWRESFSSAVISPRSSRTANTSQPIWSGDITGAAITW